MSRIGKRPVPLPSGVSVEQRGEEVHVKGPKGKLFQRLPAAIGIEVGDGEVQFVRPDDKKETRALHGLARALVANMVHGVTEGFSKELEIEGVGYRADVKGKTLNLALGFSHPVQVPVPEGLSVSLDGNTIVGFDTVAICQFAGNVPTPMRVRAKVRLRLLLERKSSIL